MWRGFLFLTVFSLLFCSGERVQTVQLQPFLISEHHFRLQANYLRETRTSEISDCSIKRYCRLLLYKHIYFPAGSVIFTNDLLCTYFICWSWRTIITIYEYSINYVKDQLNLDWIFFSVVTRWDSKWWGLLFKQMLFTWGGLRKTFIHLLAGGG